MLAANNNILDENELQENSVVKNYLITAVDGKNKELMCSNKEKIDGLILVFVALCKNCTLQYAINHSLTDKI